MRLGQEGILDVVRRRQEKWKKRLKEMNDDRTIKKDFIGELEGKRPIELDHGKDGLTILYKKTAQ